MILSNFGSKTHVMIEYIYSLIRVLCDTIKLNKDDL